MDSGLAGAGPLRSSAPSSQPAQNCWGSGPPRSEPPPPVHPRPHIWGRLGRVGHSVQRGGSLSHGRRHTCLSAGGGSRAWGLAHDIALRGDTALCTEAPRKSPEHSQAPLLGLCLTPPVISPWKRAGVWPRKHRTHPVAPAASELSPGPAEDSALRFASLYSPALGGSNGSHHPKPHLSSGSARTASPTSRPPPSTAHSAGLSGPQEKQAPPHPFPSPPRGRRPLHPLVACSPAAPLPTPPNLDF